MGFGLVLYLLGLLFNFFPPLLLYKEPARIAGTVIMVIGVYCFGGYGVEMEWRAKAEQAQKEADARVAQAKKINTKIVTKIRYKNTIIHHNGKTVTQYIDREITKYDKSCVIPKEVIKAHNAAATNTPIESEK
jgi:hypothetical protein